MSYGRDTEHVIISTNLPEIASQLAEKAKQTDLTTLQNQVNGISASPKGAYATVTDLQTAFPTGNSNVYVVTADGGWYYWSGSAWTKGGTYQATGLTEGAVKPSNTSFLKLDTTQNMFNGTYLKQYLNGSSGTLTLSSSDGRLALFVLEPNTTYSIAVSPDVTTSLKIATATAPVSVGGTFNGATNVNVGSVTKSRLVTTGASDVYMYVSVTTIASGLEPYLKVVKSPVLIPVLSGETVYPFIPSNVGIYSKTEMDVKLLASRKIKVDKTGDTINIYVPSPRSTRYTKYIFSREVDAAKSLDIWRITGLYICDSVFNVLYTLCQGYDIDGVIKISGDPDYTSGYHGYETLVAISMRMDGKEIDLSQNITTTECVEIKFTVKSIINNSGTTTKAFDKFKVLTFTKENVHIFNKLIATKTMLIEVGRLCLLSIEKSSAGIPLIDKYTENYNFLPVVFPTNANDGSTFVYNDAITEEELYGNEVYATMRIGDNSKVNPRGSITNFTTRVKMYLDCMRDATVNSNDVIFANGYWQVYS